MLSGYGQFHTNEADPEKPDKRLQPYPPITMAEVRQMADNPPSVPKPQARWCVPSTLMRRNATAQAQLGVYWALWADLDNGHLPPVADVLETLQNEVIGPVQVEVYNTRSATTERKKARIIVVLSQPLSGVDFPDCQRVLNAQLIKAGFTPDPANVGAAQLCYLPNRGEFYEAASDRQSDLFDPMEVWFDHLQELRQRAAKAAAETLRKAAEAKRRRAERTSSEGDAISVFNADYTVEELLLQQGYEQHGSHFKHPGSESGSFSASVKDGRVHSLSSNDPLYTGGSGGGAHDAFSVFTVLRHGGNSEAALRDAGDHWLTINGESWRRVKRREYAQRKAAEDHAEVDLDAMLNPDGSADTGQAKPNATTSGAKQPFSGAAASDSGRVPNIMPIQAAFAEPLNLDYVVQHILVKGWLYALTANPGSGKTAVSLYLSVMLALGRPFMGRKTVPCKVLFLCGENPQDVRIRTEVMLLDMGIPLVDVTDRIYVTRRPFAIDNKLARTEFTNDVQPHGPFDLVVIDTGPAHSKAEDENANREMHELAMAMRDLMTPIGMPCTIALMHPVKGATRDNLLPRGGGSFTGSIDGALCLWRESPQSPSELFPHREKFRGQHFESMWFDLAAATHPTARDNFGDEVQTVIAKPGQDAAPAVEIAEFLRGRIRKELLAFIAAVEDAGEWIGTSTSGPNANNPFRKSWTVHPAYPPSLMGADDSFKRVAYREIEGMVTEGLLVREARAVKPDQRQREWPSGVWLTEKGRDALLPDAS